MAGWNLVSELRIALVTVTSRHTFQRLRGRKHLRVHLGCGDDIREGWVNIDLNLSKRTCRSKLEQSGTALINHDLRLGLPLEPSSCDFIYSSHLIEHLEPRAGVRLMGECFNALCPQGTFRVVLPDYKTILKAYLKNDIEYFKILDSTSAIPELHPGTKTLIDQVNYAVYQYGEHRYIYDEEKLVVTLRNLGFKNTFVSEFRNGIDHPSPLRRKYSLYVEAVK